MTLLGSILLSVSLLLTACKSRQGKVMSDGGAPVSTAIFLEGLGAPQGSPQRIAAADALESAMGEHLTQMASGITSPSDPEGYEAKLMHRVVADTLSYLRGTTTCSDEERITLYRGYGRQPFFGSEARDGKGFMLNNIWMEALINEAKQLKASGTMVYEDRAVTWQEGMSKPNLTGDYLGQVIYDNRDKLAFALPAQDWKDLFDDYNFDNVARTHTAGEDPTILISGSLLPEVGDHFGPGVLKLAVCPQRALPVRMTSEDFYEMEVYIPFFILPEEIVDLQGFECGQLKDQDQRKGCFGNYSDADPTYNENTKILRSCLLNFDVGAPKFSRLPLEMRYTYEILDKYYSNLLAAPSYKEFMPVIGDLCKPSCETSELVTKYLKESIEKGLEDHDKPRVLDALKRSEAVTKDKCT
jgi:hypothetical protein